MKQIMMMDVGNKIITYEGLGFRVLAVQHVQSEMLYIAFYYIIMNVLFQFNPLEPLWNMPYPKIYYNNWKISSFHNRLQQI